MIQHWIVYLVAACLLIATGCASASQEQTESINTQLLRQRVDDYRRLNRPAQALFLVELLAGRGGWTPDLYLVAGGLRQDLGDLAGAVAAWERIDSQDFQLQRTLAQGQIELGRWSDAAMTLQALAESTPDDAWVRLNYGLLLAITQPQAAQDHLIAAAREPAYMRLAVAALQTITAYEDDSLLSMQLGATLVEHEAWAFAELAFDRAAQVFDPYPEALAYLSMVRDRQGKDGSAEITRAVALESQNGLVRYLQGLHLRAQDNQRAAIDALAQAVALEPQNPAYYAELAHAYQAERDLLRAEQFLQAAVDLSDGDARYREMLALFYSDEASSLTSRGMDAFQELLAGLSENADVAAGYGWSLYVRGLTEEGLAVIDEVLRTHPDHPRAMYYKARILNDQGAVEAARALLTQIAHGSSDFAVRAQSLLDILGE